LAKYGLGYILVDFFTKAFGHAEVKRYLKQDDQIGRIFAQWVIIFLGQFLKISA
jgi:hypothetical protein